MTLQTFTAKDLRYTFVLANGAVFNGTNNSLQINGLRSTAKMKGTGFPAFPECNIDVYGIKQQDMQALTSIAWIPNGLQRNTITVEANPGNGWSTVFTGDIVTAGPDYEGAPNVPLKILARAMAFFSLAPADATSYTGATDVATIVSKLASQMGYNFENAGVEQVLTNPYFSGTLTEQLRAVREQAGIEINIDNLTVSIRPKGTARVLTPFELTLATGLVGYPKLDFQRGFVSARSFYNPALRFGGPVTISGSDVLPANGNWIIGTIAHDLSSQLPGGGWFTDMLLYPPSLGIPPPVS